MQQANPKHKQNPHKTSKQNPKILFYLCVVHLPLTCIYNLIFSAIGV